MRVVDVLNALQRFPGDAEVSSTGTLAVQGVTVIDTDGKCAKPVQGTKGRAFVAADARAPRRRE